MVCHYSGGKDDGGYCDHNNYYIMAMTVPALPISWIESYTFLSYFVMFGISIALLGMGLMFGYLGDKIHSGE